MSDPAKKTPFRLSEQWAGAASVLTAVAGILCFALLVKTAPESAEQPAMALGLAGGAAVLGPTALFCDPFRAVSLVAFFSSLGALFSFMGGRVSYLAFYLSGDVMGTGLSPWFLSSAICFLLSAILAAIAMGQPFDRKHSVLAAVKLTASLSVTAVLCIAVCSAAKGFLTAGPAAAAEAVETSALEPEAAPSVALKQPSQPASYWQGMTTRQLADEDVSDKAIAYQFTATLENDSRITNHLVDLYEDGFARIFQYNGSDLVFEYNGYWRLKDEQTLFFCVNQYVYRGSAPNFEQGTVAGVDYAYDLVPADGRFAFGMNFCLGFADGGQFVRSTQIESDGSIKYEQADAYAAVLKSAEEAAAAENAAAAEDAAETGAAGGLPYPELSENAMVLEFTPDISERLKTVFRLEPVVWGSSLGISGSYALSDSDELLMSWDNNAESYQLDFFKNGTWEYRFTTMSITERGTWSFEGWQLKTVTANGAEAQAVINRIP